MLERADDVTRGHSPSPSARILVAFRPLGAHDLSFAHARDVGPHGLFVETSQPCELGTAVEITIHLPSFLRETRLLGFVRRVDETGMGLCFLVLGARETKGLGYLSGAGEAIAVPSSSRGGRPRSD